MRRSNGVRRGVLVGAVVLLGAAIIAFARVAVFAQSQESEISVSGKAPAVDDQAFIRNAIAEYGSRRNASDSLAAHGWDRMRRDRRDLAFQLFKQSWLLDPRNYHALWGFGAILSGDGKLAEAIEQLESARELIVDPVHRVALLTDLGSLYSEHAARLPADDELGRARQFILANNSFVEGLELEPGYAPGWRAWAISLLAQERYSEAWIKAQRAQELRAESFPAGFLDKLRSKGPELR